MHNQKHNKWRYISLLALLSFLVAHDIGIRIMNLPLNRVIELSYCRVWYQKHDPSFISPGGNVDERLCKVDDVQKSLAWMHGSIEGLHILCDALVTIPFGYVADKIDRRMVLAWNAFSITLMYAWIIMVARLPDILPVAAMLLGPCLSLVGGGDCVFLSTVAAVIADLAENQLQRTSFFAYQSSVTYVVALLSPALAAALMTFNLWLPFWIGIGLLIGAIPILLLVQSSKAHVQLLPLAPDPVLYETRPLLQRQNRQQPKNILKPHRKLIVRLVWDEILRTARLISGRRNFQLLCSIFLGASLASSSSTLFVQYISKRYNTTFASAGYILSVKAAINITLLIVIVPCTVSIAAKKFRASTLAIDKYGVEVSLLVSTLGALCIAFSPTAWALFASLLVYALGSALPVFTMSLVKAPDVAIISEDSNAQDYSIAILAKTCGALFGVPLMTVVWAKGIATGGLGMGLPFFVSAGVYLMAAVAASMIKKIL